MIHHRNACIFFSFLLVWSHIRGMRFKKNITKVPPVGWKKFPANKKMQLTRTSGKTHIHTLQLKCPVVQNLRKDNPILEQARDTNEDEREFWCSFVTRWNDGGGSNSINVVPSWSSWRAPLPWGSPCKAWSSVIPAAVPYVFWRERPCPPPGPCSGRCYRWKRSKWQRRIVCKLKGYECNYVCACVCQ